MALTGNSQINTYPGTVTEKGSAKTNSRTDVATLDELSDYLRTPSNEGGGGLLPVPGNLGNSVDISANMALVQTLVTLGFDMSRVAFPNETVFPRTFNYSNSKFHRASFVGADMDCSVVEGEESNLGVFTESDLSLAVFAAATIKNVQMDDCDLSYAVFGNTGAINGVTFSGSNLTGAFFDGDEFTECYFPTATLTNVNFASCVFGAAGAVTFAGAIVNGATFAGLVFDDSYNFSAITGDTADFSSCEFYATDLFGMQLENTSFSGAVIQGEEAETLLDMTDGSFVKCSFNSATFTDTDVSGCSFETCNFVSANFVRIYLGQNTSFLGCTFDSDDINEVFTAAAMSANVGDGDNVTWIDGTEYTWSTDEWVVA